MKSWQQRRCHGWGSAMVHQEHQRVSAFKEQLERISYWPCAGAQVCLRFAPPSVHRDPQFWKELAVDEYLVR